jgi:polyhydroxybutyrate depolymerase
VISRNTFLALLALVVASAGCGGEGGQTTTPNEASKDGTNTSAGADPSTGTGTSTSPEAPPATTETPPTNGCAGANGLKAGDTDLTISSGGRQRTARVHVPASYDPKKPIPVLLNFHGRMSNPSQQALLSKTTPKADAAGFVVVYPAGVGDTWNAGLCCGEAQSNDIDDVGFTRALLDELGTKLCVDAKRVFATGLSNGAFMSHRLGCELSDRIAAIGPVAGQLVMTTCKPKRPVPVMYFHGDEDKIVWYEGQYGMPSAEATAKAWATRNACNATPKETYAKGDATCMTYSGCKDSADVTLCTISGGGHTWPGGAPTGFGKTSTDIDATAEMWTFFAAHPMP